MFQTAKQIKNKNGDFLRLCLNDQRLPFWDLPIIHVCFVRCGDWTRIAAMGIKPTISEVNSNNMLDLPSVPRRNDPKSPNGRTRIGKSFSNTKTRTRVNMCKPSYGCQYLLKSLIPVISWFINPTIVCIRRPTRSHRPSLDLFRKGLEQLSKVRAGTVHSVADGRLNQRDLVLSGVVQGTSTGKHSYFSHVFPGKHGGTHSFSHVFPIKYGGVPLKFPFNQSIAIDYIDFSPKQAPGEMRWYAIRRGHKAT